MPPLFLLLLVLPPSPQTAAAAEDICIVGSGISGASTAFFLTNYTVPYSSSDPALQLRVFERRHRVGGCLATVTIAGEVFEAGGSIIHPRNLHVRRFADLLGLAAKTGGEDDEDWLGIWDGVRFVFKTLRRKLHGLANSLLLLKRYGFSLLRMDSFVQVHISSSVILQLPDFCSKNMAMHKQLPMHASLHPVMFVPAKGGVNLVPIYCQ